MNPTRILVVDDDESQRFAIRKIATFGGYLVTEAKNGAGALAALAQGPVPDLVLLDLRLPDITGREVFRHMKEHDATAAIPVVFMTSHRLQTSDRVDALREGADAYLQIPIASAEVLATIRSVLRLRRAERLARESVAMREQILALVSRDLRNPLSAISLTGELLRRQADPGAAGDHVRRHAGIIGRSVARMDRLVSDLADIASIQSGRLAIERAPVFASALLQECAEAHMGAAHKAGIAFTSVPPDDDVEISADRQRILQVLANLTTNAIKFTQSGGEVELAMRPEAGGVAFSVRDTGPGIPEESRAKIFDRFWQAAETADKGTGLGLSIAKAIVEAHGGRIWVDSTCGKGSTFTFTVPG